MSKEVGAGGRFDIFLDSAYTVSFFLFSFMPSQSNASYLLIARFVFVFLNIISISEVLKKIHKPFCKHAGGTFLTFN